MKKSREKANKGSSLPINRKELYLDIIKQRWRTLFLLGFIFFLSFLPFVGAVVLRRLYYPVDGDSYNQYVFNVLFILFICLCLLIPSIFLGGILKNLKHLSYEEPIFFKEDFFDGIKESFLHLFFLFLIFSILLYFNLVILMNLSIHIAIKGVLLGIIVFIAFPLLITAVFMEITYKNTFKDLINNSFAIYIKNFWSVALVAILNLLPFLSLLIQNVIIMGTCLVAFYLLFNQLLMLFDMLFFNYIFDISINKEHYPEIYRKGLFTKDKK